MPIRRELKAFWWFVEGRVGGMGRPGYNQCHWYDLSLEEGMVLSWLGRQSQTSSMIESLWAYLDVYGPEAYFEVYHLPVDDVTPPTYEQVYAFAAILHTALAAGKNVVIHCLAGVGRTTTMLLAAALVQGHAWDTLVTRVQTCNPHFQFRGRQVAFLQALANDITTGHRPLLSTAKEASQCR